MAGRLTEVVRAYVRRRTAAHVAVILVFAAGVAAGAAALDLVAEDGRTALLGEVRSL